MNKEIFNMKRIFTTINLLTLFLVFGLHVKAQLESTIFNTETRIIKESDALFFTNRPILVNEDNSFSFTNKSTDKTNTLYFCSYDFETDSIYLNARTINLSNQYPTEKPKYNLFYEKSIY